MEKVGAGLLYFIIFLILLYGVWSAIRLMGPTHSLGVSESTVALQSGEPGAFRETGILFFYPNNMGPIPYLLYYDSSGEPHTKGLLISPTFISDLSLERYAYKPVTVTGSLEAEHVRVSTVEPL